MKMCILRTKGETMLNNTSNHSRKNGCTDEIVKLLDNIYFTKMLVDDLLDQREDMIRKVSRAGIACENGKYIYGDNAAEDIIALATEAQKLDEQIIKTTTRLISREKAATNLISLLSDYRSRLLIIKRYIDNKSIEVIAEEMNYSPRHVQRMISDAVKNLNEIYLQQKNKKRLP